MALFLTGKINKAKMWDIVKRLKWKNVQSYLFVHHSSSIKNRTSWHTWDMISIFFTPLFFKALNNRFALFNSWIHDVFLHLTKSNVNVANQILIKLLFDELTIPFTSYYSSIWRICETTLVGTLRRRYNCENSPWNSGDSHYLARSMCPVLFKFNTI